jgi:hypothetical protein
MSLENGVEDLNKKIQKVSDKLKTAIDDGLSIRRRANLRAKLDNLCEERDFYKSKIREEN